MASILKTATKEAGKRKADDAELGQSQDANGIGSVARKNKQRVLMLPSRGVTSQMRHLVTDLEALMPHCKKGECTLVAELADVFRH